MYETYGARKFVCMAPNIPNMGNWSCDGIVEWGEGKDITSDAILFDPATLDATSLVLQAASLSPDAIITTMPAGVAIPIFQAAEEGLRDQFHWFGLTSPNDLAFPSAVNTGTARLTQIELVN
jgi:branched-chain amino acid transport system substrate-binding protein